MFQNNKKFPVSSLGISKRDIKALENRPISCNIYNGAVFCDFILVKIIE